MYARLRGVPSAEVRHAVEDLIERIDLSEYADRCGRQPHSNSAPSSQSLQRLREDILLQISVLMAHLPSLVQCTPVGGLASSTPTSYTCPVSRRLVTDW